jgi:DNA repair photolyase
MIVFTGWEKVKIKTDGGEETVAIAPLIISASRSTDIPAFYPDWFMNRLEKGYSKWINPFNRKPQYVSFRNAKVIVFWSKNPQPLLEYLPEIDKRGISYYFQFTVNDYKEDGFEPNVPPFADRIETFKELSSKIGKEKVVWRFDPLLLTDTLDTKSLLSKIANVGNSLHSYTKKLVISFADISTYSKVQRNLKAAGIKWREFQTEEIEMVAAGIKELNKGWGLEVATCAEKVDLKHFSIVHNRCIDDKLIMRIRESDQELMSFLGYEPERQQKLPFGQKTENPLKDKGQRKECGCIVSKDIGQYNTCKHLCVYCYANYSRATVERNRLGIDTNSEAILPNS